MSGVQAVASAPWSSALPPRWSDQGLDLDKVSVVSGIGCSGRVAGYMRLDAFHTTHGRAIPFATGLKLGRPELEVAVVSGDGDLVGIGGNHFIHAARRNIDLLVIMINNFIYGMTGGQNAPTTPLTARIFHHALRKLRAAVLPASSGGQLRGALCGALDLSAHTPADLGHRRGSGSARLPFHRSRSHRVRPSIPVSTSWERA